MRNLSKVHKVIIAIYTVLILLFVGLFAYMGMNERAEIYQVREFGAHQVVENIEKTERFDEDLPVGKIDEYVWNLGEIERDTNCLAFYLIHQEAEVYIADELVYSISVSEDNRVGENISNNWVSIPIYTEDSNQLVRVIVTPLVADMADREVEFLYGSPLTMYKQQLRADMIELALSFVFIGLGLMFIFAQFLFFRNKGLQTKQISLLGVFAIMIGFWRITDTRFSSVLFVENPMVLGYITVGTLFLCVVPILLYIRTLFLEENTKVLTGVIYLSIGVSAVAWILQVTGTVDLRHLMTLSHAMILVAVVAAIYTVFFRKKAKVSLSTRFSKIMIFILSAGAVTDVVNYYFSGGLAGLICLMIAFLIYAMSLFVKSSVENTKHMYTDTDTGLFNRKRWDVLMERMRDYTKPIGLIMFDINDLKYINDTMGHETGDKAILNFSNALRNSITLSNTICRWGGDEFTVLVLNATKEELEAIMNSVKVTIQKYNETGIPKISYAGGYVLSTEFPELTPEELFKKADERMYLDKKKWHAEHPHN